MQQDFTKQLIKGRIAEIIFDQMFRDAKFGEERKFTVIPFGYENVMPELMQTVQGTKYNYLVDTIRNAPDFALVRHIPTEVFLVEVKYRSNLVSANVRETTAKILERWKMAYVFYATPEGFYFDKCSDLTKNDATITPLSEEMVSKDLQEKYLGLLREFIGQN